jgi:hypothetical protein
MKGELVRVGIIDRDELDARIHHRRYESELLDSESSLAIRALPFAFGTGPIFSSMARAIIRNSDYKPQGAAGVDGQSIAEFEANLSGNLYKLWNRPGDVLPIVPKEL